MIKGIKPIWWVALVGVCGLVWWSMQLGQGDAGIELRQTTPSASKSNATPSPQEANVQAEKTNRTEWFESLKSDIVEPAAGDPFHSAKPQSQQAPEPPPILPPDLAIAPPIVPIEVSLPFQYLGKLERNGRLDIYLDLQGNPLVAHIGDTLPEGWRLERLDSAGLNFTHLATQRSQVLPLGATP